MKKEMLGISKISDNVDTFEVKDSGYVLTGSVQGYRKEYFFFFYANTEGARTHNNYTCCYFEYDCTDTENCQLLIY